MGRLQVHIYYDSNKTRETSVHIGYFIHSGVFMCFYKIVYGYPGIQIFVCQHGMHGVPSWHLTLIHAIVSRSSWGHGSVASDKRHCQQWTSSLFCGFLPNPFIQGLFLWRTSQEFVKTDLYPLSLIFFSVCRLFDRALVDTRPLRRSLPTV